MPQLNLPYILHLTILNPAIHTRIFYKIALSQQKLGAKVAIAGQSNENKTWQERGITIYGAKPFGRFAWERFARQFSLFKLAWQLNPDILTIHAAELLFLALIYKLFRPKTHLIYDVHENYYYNIRYSHPNPNFLHLLIGKMVRQVEKWSVKYLDAVCYAEECYENILAVPDEKKYFLRNKFTAEASQNPPKLPIPNRPYMLYTGTIDVNRGILETLDLWKKINQEQPFLLVVAGHTFTHQLVAQIHEFVTDNQLDEQFLMYGGNEYLSYNEVVHFIEHCAFGTGFYNTDRKNIAPIIPTKIYEFMAFNKALVYNKNPHWDLLNERWQFGIAIESELNVKELLSKLQYFSAPNRQNTDWNWETEEVEMKRMLEKLMANR